MLVLAPADLNLPDKFAEWRSGGRWTQWDTIAQIVAAPEQVTVVQAPTGSGKSPMGIAVARFFDYPHTVYLTGTKQLQDQLAADFALPVLKGRQNYGCHELRFVNRWATADQGPCTGGWQCPSKEECEYYVAKWAAAKAPIATLNYAFFLADANYAYNSPFRLVDLLVADECHELERWLLNFVSADLYQSTFGRLNIRVPKLSQPSGYYVWALTIAPQVRSERWRLMDELGIRYETLEETDRRRLVIPPEAMRKPAFRLWQTANALNRTLTSLLTWLDPRKQDETPLEPVDDDDLLGETPAGKAGLDLVDRDWVVRELKDRHGAYNGVQLLPVWVKRFAPTFYFNHAKRHVLMSATVLRADLMARILGLPEQEVGWVESPSIFPKQNRPIYRLPLISLAKRDLADNLPKLSALAHEMLARYENGKGLIHSGNFTITRYLLEHDQTGRMVTYESGGMEHALEAFKASPDPLVLVGPSLHTGVDIPGGRWRGGLAFNWVAKLPYPDLGDEQTRRRAEQDPDWYTWVTACALVQATGRGVRSETDVSDTWITDRAFNMLWGKTKAWLPKWWREALVWDPAL